MALKKCPACDGNGCTACGGDGRVSDLPDHNGHDTGADAGPEPRGR